MEKREYRIDYQWEEEPLLVLPLCVGGMLLSGELFGWLNSLEPGGLPSDQLAAIRIVYFGFLLCCSALAAWRLIRTIHATKDGLEYRFLGKVQKRIPWETFSCAAVGRARQMKTSLIFLIPAAIGELPADRAKLPSFLTKHYTDLIRFHRTRNNIRAIGAYLEGV